MSYFAIIFWALALLAAAEATRALLSRSEPSNVTELADHRARLADRKRADGYCPACERPDVVCTCGQAA